MMSFFITYGIIHMVLFMEYQYNSQLAYGRGYVYRIQYHIVWCVKYRKPVLTGQIEQFVKNDLLTTAEELGVSIVALEMMPDHAHMLVNCSPQHYIPTLIKILKGNSARHLFMVHPEIKSSLCGGHLWNPSYFISTVSENTASEVKAYINSQKSKP